MPASAGKDLVILVNTTGTTFAPIMGLRTKSVDFGTQQVDVTNSDSIGRWRELLGGAGVNSMNFKGQGVFQDDPAFNSTFDAYIGGIIKTYQVIIPNLAQITGQFLVSDMNFAGQYNQELTADITFASAAALTIQRY